MFKEKIFVTRPLLPPLEEYQLKLKQIWENKWLTNYGPFEHEFQSNLKKLFDAENVELFANGHTSLDLAIKSLDLDGEVITTPFTFASTTQAIIGNNLKPVFADVEREYYNLNPENIESLITEKTSAIIPVHVFGNPCEVKKIEKIAKKYDLKVIYDAAHAFGVKIDNESIVNFGDISMLSFHATKVFNTIEGGALIFKDKELSNKLKALKNFGITPDKEEVRYLGKNGKMNEFEAAMGLCNLNKIDDIFYQRSLIYNRYLECLEDLEDSGDLKLIHPQNNVFYNYAYFTIKLNSIEERDFLYGKLAEYNVFARKYFYPPCNEFPAYDFDRNTPIAKDISNTILSLPLYIGLSLDDVNQISKIIKIELKNFKNL
ncbi:MAG: DegT/DnrJ/EryC1/StrS family aminotransferase [Methanobrevibacter olleyae]|uniref:DegT/DnrJ/EryC1/StrS family aminotransferase n=1 Tax=Methanobrevibacter olleyae TaxID=294671 RepID=A0A8T3VN13_METOL|nr:DegT/DnrJ/EryC1/StrS family aminotransferase [Methanobrevibacter olleyae]